MNFSDTDHYAQVTVAGADGTVKVPVCHRTLTQKAKTKGLLGSDGLGDGEGLLITGEPLLHMVGMRFPVDIVFLSPRGKVLRIFEDVQPGWRLRGHALATKALEVGAGQAKALGITKGERLTIS